MDKIPADWWLEEAIRAHGDSLLRLCFLYLRDRQLAEDAVQETFVRAWRAYGDFRQDSSDKTWLTRIAVNVCKSALRRERPLPLSDAPEGSYEAQFRDDTVLQAVCALPQKLREVVLLYYFQELSTPEIARMLHLPRNVITARLSRARAQLKTDLKGWYFDEQAETASQ
ncbi:MAG: sigma-70 family RNA polymerase sigma factor [Clostridia bacterium]|nr:sigma-70 family RNA polymerase sigma factor [Clostridia bacterium]